MTFRTEGEAAKLKCPISRTFDAGKKPNCDGDNCMLWRWRDLPLTSNRFRAAIARVEMDLITEHRAGSLDTKKTNASFTKEATAKVVAAPWDFIFTNENDRGYCGLGGKP